MFRKSLIAVTALAALGIAALSPTTASAGGGKWGGGGWKGGWGGWHHHHHFGRYDFRFYGVAAPDCYAVYTRRGFIRYICD